MYGGGLSLRTVPCLTGWFTSTGGGHLMIIQPRTQKTDSKHAGVLSPGVMLMVVNFGGVY